MRLANGIVLDKEKTFEVQSAGTHDTGIYPSGNPCQGLPYNAEVELINPIADTVANANYRGADVEWYIKADDIVLKNKGGQPAGNPQGQPKK